MLILGIETSCDETAVAILNDNEILVNLVSSQLLHQQFGGVVPEFASREHMRLLDQMVKEAFVQTGLQPENLDGIAVTRGPGLMGALLVGLSFAKGLAYSLRKPLLGVNHIEGHIMANFLTCPDLKFPFLCLLVSGGHTQIIQVNDFGNYQILGRSVDDAAGEAFDKAARILELPYPGGPQIDQMAHRGDPNFYQFPRAKVRSEQYDFSFSGLKTAMLYLVRQRGQKWAQENLADLCAAYQEAIVDVLKINTFTAVKNLHANKLVLAGGVAANSRLRQVFQEQADYYQIELIIPSLKYCTDNAAMIARTGQEMLSRNQISPFSISAVPNLTLTTK
ncbi:MAG TPA: tRNA (adenosine(37)-N6)-threonylcarbamoyltransferase complex transferase subunit TsaD [Candidatus Marinimicrobia bacterium]|jgi:N6-L-threonylcarbamoyladenine synthase|nr:tRNA (adenosine(37)-N6)-threonylcarbamoyltransferase complex transferase subunit TsaD [Candidatus Neomarinimicrobiota bacterium]HOU16754.1 tRNA (adenosine(37)-N6)-threonylcarbamoyltransferase complex transferase subunit TsaD [Candidatus Neomarinimicrobiota bacterium]HOV22759.1 tRNA (adenosine(37)-N6)-threonylcarbamoyltransferase complex transferase subunit TsaD [Candidatus Neomarinimicrobiota bacterium]HQE95410.1 tRNA (adenosine(37)-N6)-threonylcarbamoyltransferase complex transferase subunit